MIEGWYNKFKPDPDVPLVVEFIQHAKNHGISSRIRFDSWDFELYDGVSDDFQPSGLVKTVRNGVSDKVLELMLRDPAPLKFILAEGERFSLSNLEPKRTFLAATGTGIYVRSLGWLVLPGLARVETQKDLRLQMSPNWYQDEAGAWLKTCSKCGIPKGERDFYPNYRNNTRDPYQARCKACWSVDNRRTYLRQRELN